VLAARSDPREVVCDPHARYFGIAPSERTLLPGDDARLGTTHLGDWLRSATPQAPRRDTRPDGETSHA